jgi:F-type H+-transporting ATPase subunit b
MFLKVDGTFFIQLVNFAIFFTLLNVLFLRPVGRAIAQRRDYIKSVTRDYDSYQGEANALRANDERLRAEARREAEQIVAKGRADASNATAEIATKYGTQAQAVVEEAQRQAASELEAARAASQQKVGELAGLMVDRALSEAAR